MRTLLAILALHACTRSESDGMDGAPGGVLTAVDPALLYEVVTGTPRSGDTGTGPVEPLHGSSVLGVGILQDPAWVEQYGGAGFDEGFAVVPSPDGTYVGGTTRSSWYGTFLDTCLDDVNTVPRDCGDAVLFETTTMAGVQVGNLASDEVRGIALFDDHVRIGGRIRAPVDPEDGDTWGGVLNGFVMSYSTDLSSLEFDSRMPNAKFLGLAGHDTKAYAVGGTPSDWEPGETSFGEGDALAMKLGPKGDIKAVQQEGSKRRELLHDVQVDNDAVYIAGTTSGYLGVPGGDGAGSEDALLFVWSHTLEEVDEICRVQFGTKGRDGGEGVAVQGDALYIVGNATGEMSNGFPDGAACFHQNPDELPDAYVAKFDKLCNPVWARSWGSDLADAAEGVAADDKHVYVVGYAFTKGDHEHEAFPNTTNGFLRVYTHAGELVGEVMLDGSTSEAEEDLRVDYARGVAVDDDFVYVTGTTAGAMGTTPNLGDHDIFLAKIPKADAIDNVAFDGDGCE